jgi:hypothetical protein
MPAINIDEAREIALAGGTGPGWLTQAQRLGNLYDAWASLARTGKPFGGLILAISDFRNATASRGSAS